MWKIEDLTYFFHWNGINWKDASDRVNKDTDVWLEIGEVGEYCEK